MTSMESRTTDLRRMHEFLYSVACDDSLKITTYESDNGLVAIQCSRDIKFSQDSPVYQLLNEVQARMHRLNEFVEECLWSSPNLSLQALGERLYQQLMNIMLKCISWESELKSSTTNFTLSRLRYELSGPSETLDFLDYVVSKLDLKQSCAETIDTLSEIRDSHTHERSIRECSEALLEAAFEPYGKVLIQYMLTGSTASDLYGDCLGTVFPKSLQPYAEKIAHSGMTGGYLSQLNVDVYSDKDRVCLNDILREGVSTPVKLLDPYFAFVFINEAVSITGAELFNQLNKDDHIACELGKIKKFFFIGNSVWFRDFLTNTVEELDKPVSLLNKPRVMDQLRRVTKSEVSGMSFHSFSIDEALIQINQWDTYDDGEIGKCGGAMQLPPADTGLSGIKSITLVLSEYAFPHSLLFTARIQFKVQTIFRILSYTKFVSMRLSDLWVDFQSMKELGGSQGSHAFFSAQALLQRMQHFVQTYMFFQNLDVTEIHFAALVNELNREKNDVFRFQGKLNKILSLILSDLTFSSSIQKLINKVLSTCALYSAHMQRFIAFQTNVHEDVELVVDHQQGGAPQATRMDILQYKTDAIENVVQQDNYVNMINKFKDAFEHQMNSLVVLLTKHDSHKTNGNSPAALLVDKLDFNEFFTSNAGINY